MAIFSGTTESYAVGTSARNIREDLEDTIWDLFPMDTYFITNAEKVKASATFHEWLADNLAAASNTNRQIEGDDITASATVTSATRYGNYTQIARKTFVISNTLEVTNRAGRKSEVARQAMKLMRELKRDVESSCLGQQISSVGGNGTARAMGGLESWIASTDNSGNGVRATTTASASTAAYASGVTGAVTDGTTTGAITEAKLKEAIGLAWTDGGSDHVILVNSTQKQAITAISGITTRFSDVPKGKQAAIVSGADVFVSDYGVSTVILNRYVRQSVILCVDMEMVALAQLRPFQTIELATTGDAEKRMLIWEGTLVCRNPNAHSKVQACA